MSGEWVEEKCNACNRGKVTCLNCHGTGGSMGNKNPDDNWICDDCQGLGKVDCDYCGGSGFIPVRRTERDDRNNGHR